jgi:K+/H+ antiporter YhaU regulatory subunit KhtT
MTSIAKFSNRLLQKGGHILIIGWSALGLEVVRELSEANRNVRKPRIIIASQESIESVEAELTTLDLGRQKFQIINAPKKDLKQLSKQLAEKARAVIDLDADLSTLMNEIELRCKNNLPLTSAINEVLSFVGEEMYFRELPALFGKTYADAVLAFNTASVLGLLVGGKAVINPEPSLVIEQGAQVIALAEDDDKVVYTGIRNDALAKLKIKDASKPLSEITKPYSPGDGLINLNAKLLAQFAENSALADVYGELFGIGGQKIFIAPVELFSPIGEDLEFSDLAVAAISSRCSAIGYSHAGTSKVILNPAKTDRFRPATGDGLVVIGDLK